MARHKQGLAIPGAITSTEFARKPSTHLQAAIESGQTLFILKHNHVLAAIVPVGTEADDENPAPSNPAANEGGE